MKNKAYEDIKESLKVLGLTDGAVCKDVKKRYYILARKYHPDKCFGVRKKRCEEQFKKINNAYKIVTAYCQLYGRSLNLREIKKNTLGEEYYNHLRRFYDGWWGSLDL